MNKAELCLYYYNKTPFINFADVARAIELLEKLQASGEVPVTKLAALQKVLQSDFLNAVREVYEHVYETVDIQGSPDVRASATAKACVAAFAASEGHAHPRVVELPKTDEGLGFNVMGGKEQNSPIYISRIIPGGFIFFGYDSNFSHLHSILLPYSEFFNLVWNPKKNSSYLRFYVFQAELRIVMVVLNEEINYFPLMEPYVFMELLFN